MRFYKNGELKDRKIVAALRKAAADYENGSLIEVRDLLLEIADAIDEFASDQAWEELKPFPPNGEEPVPEFPREGM